MTTVTNNQLWKHRFEETINRPLAGVIGRRLHRVSLAVLGSDSAGFDVNNPNASGGCQAVILDFDDSRLVVEWASKPCFTEGIGGIMFHIMPRLVSPQAEITQQLGGDYKEVSADSAPDWKDYVGCELEQVVVFNEGESPQALQFIFLPGNVALAVGSTYDYPNLHVGDGNEILHLKANQLPQRWQASCIAEA